MSKALELARQCGVFFTLADKARIEAFFSAAFEAGRQAAIAEFAQAIDGIEVKHD